MAGFPFRGGKGANGKPSPALVLRPPALSTSQRRRPADPHDDRRIKHVGRPGAGSWSRLRPRPTRTQWRGLLHPMYMTKFLPLFALPAVAIAVWSALSAEGWLLGATCGFGWTLLVLA